MTGVPVPFFYWPAFALLNAAVAANMTLTGNFPLALAAALMLIGGLPHGAFDIAIARKALRLDRLAAVKLVSAYLGVALAMIGLWAGLPLAALCLFLMLSAVHFGDDWKMIDSGLLRAMAGASVLCIPAFFHPTEVSALFVAMAGDGADWVRRVLIAFTPVALLVTSVGMWQAVKAGSAGWALAQLSALMSLAYLPPQIGFVLFFVFLHSPLHMRALSDTLSGWSRRKMWIYGTSICSVCFLAAGIFAPALFSGQSLQMSSEGFRILSVVAAPHLLLTLMLGKLCAPSGMRTSPTR